VAGPALDRTVNDLTIWGPTEAQVFNGRWLRRAKSSLLTPFYSPCISGECAPGASSLGRWLHAIRRIIPYALVSLPLCRIKADLYYYRRPLPGLLARSPPGRGERSRTQIPRRGQGSRSSCRTCTALILLPRVLISVLKHLRT